MRPARCSQLRPSSHVPPPNSLYSETLKRLKNWEIRERKKFRDYSKDAEREDERRRETVSGANEAASRVLTC